MTDSKVLTISDCFSDVPDPRVDRTKKHLLIDIMTIALCSLISGGETFNDMELFGQTKEDWLRTFCELPHGIPSHDTFRRVFARLNPKKFSQSFFKWVKAFLPKNSECHVSIDGKVLKGSARKRKQISPISLVSAWCTENSGLMLGQVKTENKSNEIKAIPELLETLQIKGAILSIDAMGCQKAIAQKIRDQKGDYVLGLKGNQKNIYEEVKSYFKSQIENNLNLQRKGLFHDYFEGKYGRLVRRRVWVIHDMSSLKSLHTWPGIHSVIAMEGIRQTHKGGKVSSEYRYFLCSIKDITAKQADKLVRNHWSIENHLHWSLDVVFLEDDSRIREEKAAQNMGLLRRLGVSLLKNETSTKISLKQKRLKCALDHTYLIRVLQSIS